MVRWRNCGWDSQLGQTLWKIQIDKTSCWQGHIARNAVQNLIWKKKNVYFEEKQKANMQILKSLGNLKRTRPAKWRTTLLRLSQKERFGILPFCYIWRFSKILFKSVNKFGLYDNCQGLIYQVKFWLTK